MLDPIWSPIWVTQRPSPRANIDAGFSIAGTSLRTKAPHKSAEEAGPLKAVNARVTASHVKHFG
jgi:hypothetical protein